MAAMLHISRRPRSTTWAFLLLAVIYLIYFTRGSLHLRHSRAHVGDIPSTREPKSGGGGLATEHVRSEDFKAYWYDLHQAIIDNKPDIDPVPKLGSPPREIVDPDFKLPLGQLRPPADLLKLSDSDVESLQREHDSFVAALKDLAPRLPYRKRSRGIVMASSKSQLGVALTSLLMLRRSGSKLPVHLFVESEADLDSHICGEVLPAMDVECVTVSDLLGAGDASLERDQYKVMSILLSPFQQVIFLDSTCWPVHNPDYLLKSEPFASRGLVTWPDFWLVTASPLFYKIARLDDGLPDLASRTNGSQDPMVSQDGKNHKRDGNESERKEEKKSENKSENNAENHSENNAENHSENNEENHSDNQDKDNRNLENKTDSDRDDENSNSTDNSSDSNSSDSNSSDNNSLESAPHRHRATDAGIIMYDKSRHAASLLLAAYYNWHGPKHYYPLLSQGAMGEGDKETFLHAAAVLRLPHYSVRRPVAVLGRELNGTFRSVGMLQHDPVEDFKLGEEQAGRRQSGESGEFDGTQDKNKGKGNDKEKGSDGDDGRAIPNDHDRNYPRDPVSGLGARPLWVHHNIWKLDLRVLGRPDDDGPFYRRNATGHQTRMWGNETAELVDRTGFDVERALWDTVLEANCARTFLEECRGIADYYEGVFGEKWVLKEES